MKKMRFTHHQRIAGFRDLKDLLDIKTTDNQESSVVVSGVTKQDTTHNLPSDDNTVFNFLNEGAYLGCLSDEECMYDAESSTEGPGKAFKSENPKKRKKNKKRCRLEFLIEACRLVTETENNGAVDDASDMKSSVISK